MDSRTKVLLLRTAALEWLKFQKRCALVMHERGPLSGPGVPDVIGVTNSMHVIEIEIKITVADFRSNMTKHAFQWQQRFPERAPYQFFFLVWPDMLDVIKPEVPAHCGLMSSQSWTPRAEVIFPAAVNRKSQKMDHHQWVRAVNLQGNALVSATRKCYELASKTEPVTPQIG